jgi:hypothetical protein
LTDDVLCLHCRHLRWFVKRSYCVLTTIFVRSVWLPGHGLLQTLLMVPIAFLLTIGASPLRAEETTLTINTGNMYPAGYSRPNDVTINLDSSSTIATVTLDSLTNGGQDQPMTDGGSADLNALMLEGGAWSSAADVLSRNDDGDYAAMHGDTCTTPCTASEGSAGLAADSKAPASTPAPTSMLLFGSGLLLIGGILRRQFRRARCEGTRKPSRFWPTERGHRSAVSVSSAGPD